MLGTLYFNIVKAIRLTVTKQILKHQFTCCQNTKELHALGKGFASSEASLQQLSLDCLLDKCFKCLYFILI